MVIRLAPDVADALQTMRKYEMEPINDVLRRLIGKSVARKSLKKSKEKSAEATSDVWRLWCDAYRNRYNVDYPRNAKNNALIKTLVEKIGVENAKKVIPFYTRALDPWIVSRQHPLEVLVKDAESWVAREANGQLLISRSKISAYDSSVSWSEVASKVARELQKNGDQDEQD